MPEVHDPDAALSLRDVFDVLPRAIVVFDPDGRIVFWNRRAEELYGWTEDEVVGRTTIDVLSPMEPPEDDWDVVRRVLEGERYLGDRTVLHRNGERLRTSVLTNPILDPDGSVRWIVAAAEDVGDLRRSARRHQDLTDRLQLAIDAAGLGTWRWDLTTGSVHWDRRMEELFGFEPGEFDGTFEAYRDALHPEDRDRVLARVQRAVEERSDYRVEHQVLLRDGSVRWIQGAGRVTLSPEGVVTGAIGCSMDVTDRVAAREASEHAASVARQAAERERIDRERFQLLAEINHALADAATTEEIKAAVTRAAVPMLGDWCSIHLLPENGGPVPEVETFHVDPELVDWARELAERFPYDPDALTGMPAVIRSGQAEFLPEITPVLTDLAIEISGYEGEQAEELRAIFDRLALRSAISVPLIKRGRVLGGISFATTTDRRPLTEEDLELAWVVAGRVASSVENRRLTDAQRRIASTLQASLLPASLPSVPGLDIAVRYWAAGEATDVGGDFYDVFEAGDGEWTALIGDVCGTGPGAASLLALARHTVRQSVWRGDDPVEVLRWLNRAMHESIGRATSFLTTDLVGLRPAGDHIDITVTCAGHPPAVLVRADGQTTVVGSHGRLIGVFEEVRAEPVHDRLLPGDTLVLYTDGLTDMPPPHLLTVEQTAELIAAAVTGLRSADDIARSLEREIEKRRLLQDRADDIAVVILHAT